jgi:hypothetical protein
VIIPGLGSGVEIRHHCWSAVHRSLQAAVHESDGDARPCLWPDSHRDRDRLADIDACSPKPARARSNAALWVTGLPRTGGFETDGSAVTLENQNIVPNSIYRPNQPALGVRAPEAMYLGEDLCFSGVMEKEVKCGAILRFIRVHPEHEFYEPPGNAGIVVEPEMGKSFEIKPGDSGSPVWDAATNALVGVVSAGVGNEATERSTLAPVLGLPIKHPGRAPGILSALGGELKIELE